MYAVIYVHTYLYIPIYASSQHWEPDRWGSPRSEDRKRLSMYACIVSMYGLTCKHINFNGTTCLEVGTEKG